MDERRGNRPLSRRLQARVMAAWNVPMRAILGLPFPTPLGRRLMLVTFIGRRSGRTYRQPLSYVRRGETLLTPGGGNWTHNLSDGRAVSIRLRGRDLQALPELVADVDEVERLLDVITTANPAAKAFIRIPSGPDGRLARDGVVAAVHRGFRVVRWHLADGRPTT